nr:hypothetical protein [Tanacetum cinerariifolium]
HWSLGRRNTRRHCVDVQWSAVRVLARLLERPRSAIGADRSDRDHRRRPGCRARHVGAGVHADQMVRRCLPGVSGFHRYPSATGAAVSDHCCDHGQRRPDRDGGVYRTGVQSAAFAQDAEAAATHESHVCRAIRQCGGVSGDFASRVIKA